MAERRRSKTRTASVAAAVGLVLVAVAIGVTGWVASKQGEARFCTAAGSAGNPVGATPEDAFALWWEAGHPDGPPVDDADVERDGNVWQVAKGTPEWRQVEVDRADYWLDDAERAAADEQGFTVIAANRCSSPDT